MPSWSDDVVAATVGADDGRQRTFAGLVVGTEYSVLKQTGAEPAATDVVLAVMSGPTIADRNSQITRQSITNKKVYEFDPGSGTTDLTVRNDDDTADVLTIKGYNPRTGATAAPEDLEIEEIGS